MNIADNISERIAALDKDQRDHLQHLFVHLVVLVENPSLKGFLMHTLPSPPDSEIEPVLMHSVHCDITDVEDLMCNFLAAKNALAAQATGTDPTRSH